MEIEYKFGISNDETFHILSKLEKAGSYVLKDKSRPLFTDIFYDTSDLLLFSLGFYLRKRFEKGIEEAEWTLKQADTAAVDVHRRNEFKQKLSSDSTPKDLTHPDFQKHLMIFVGEAPLLPILTLEQDRFFKTVFKEGISEHELMIDSRENVLADLSVDLVTLKLSGQNYSFTELEVELAAGTEGELEKFVSVLRRLPELQLGLYPNSLSKFERGLILFFNRDKIEGNAVSGFETQISTADLTLESESDEQSDGEPSDLSAEFNFIDSGFLKPREKAALIQICEKEYTVDSTDFFGNTGFLKQTGSELFGLHTHDAFFKKASLLLALDSGMPLGFAAMTFRLSKSEVSAIRHEFEFSRLNLFPFSFQADLTSSYRYRNAASKKTQTKEELAALYGMNPAFAEKRAKNAASLFDFLGPAYGLAEKDKDALTAVSYLKGIGKGISVETDVCISTDILLTHPVSGFSSYDLKILGLIFIINEQTAKTSEEVLKAVRSTGFFVPPVAQKKAFILALLLEIVGIADENQAEILELKLTDKVSGIVSKREVEIVYSSVREKFKKTNIGSLNKILESVFGFSIRFTQSKTVPVSDNSIILSDLQFDFQILPEDEMANAAEKILLLQFQEAEKAEPGVISANDIEDVHDMRVALRKIRSSLLIFREYLDSVRLTPLEKGVKKTLSTLGPIRDLDVLLEKTDSYLKSEAIDPKQMSVFYEIVSQDREKAHEEAVRYLNSKEYVSFKKEFKETLEIGVYLGNPSINRKGDIAPVRVRDVLPSVLYKKAADVTAYYEWLEGPFLFVDKLHRLRIAAKNFRYTLDFFKDCLGDASVKLIKEFKELQDILGDFHDAVVAIEMIDAYMKRIEGMKADVSADRKDRLREIEAAVGVLGNYKAFREQEIESLLSIFQMKHETMTRRFFHERLSKILTDVDF